MESSTELTILLGLIDEKEAIEKKLQSLGKILIDNNIDMKEPLVTEDGYPRSDIDVYQVRHGRHAINCLQNDYKTLMKKIDHALEIVHQEASDRGCDPNGTDVSMSSCDLTPFAMIQQVDFGSPADIDGLKMNDEICKFGSVNSENYRNMDSIGKVVQHSKNHPVEVIILRDDRQKRITLTPRSWQGRGLLGCLIVPLEKVER